MVGILGNWWESLPGWWGWRGAGKWLQGEDIVGVVPWLHFFLFYFFGGLGSMGFWRRVRKSGMDFRVWRMRSEDCAEKKCVGCVKGCVVLVGLG